MDLSNITAILPENVFLLFRNKNVFLISSNIITIPTLSKML